MLSGCDHKQEKGRSWTALKAQLRRTLDNFLASCPDPVGGSAIAENRDNATEVSGNPKEVVTETREVRGSTKEVGAGAEKAGVEAVEVTGEVEEVSLPPHLFCICLGEPELGLQATDIPCTRCGQVCVRLKTLLIT